MNRIIFTVLMLITNLVIYSQVGIETTSIHTDAILDFPTEQNKGIVLPMVEALPTGAAASNGTFLIDKTDGRVKVRQNGIWLNLTGTSSLSSYSVNPSADTFDGVIIGATSSSASGVLVLEELDNFKDNGFEVETLNWPRIMKNSKEYKLGIEVVTLLDNPFVSVENGRI